MTPITSERLVTLKILFTKNLRLAADVSLFKAVQGGEKVLVCAPSNVAVDNLLERLHNHRYLLSICLTLNIT